MSVHQCILEHTSTIRCMLISDPLDENALNDCRYEIKTISTARASRRAELNKLLNAQA